MAKTNFYANPTFEKVHFRTEFIRFVENSGLASPPMGDEPLIEELVESGSRKLGRIERS